MDKSLVTRIVLVCVVVGLYLVASRAGWYPRLVGPVAVLSVALIMFWPKRGDGGEGGDAPSRSEMLREIREEQRR